MGVRVWLPRARFTLFMAITLVLLAWRALGPAPVTPAYGSVSSYTAMAANETTSELTHRVAHLSEEVKETQTIEKYVLGPFAILVAILAAGGALGIVFSFRDQRRTSQLHELTVTGEVASQRRSEQSYGSFLEQSQTTLALVNDTLKLAKDATAEAAHGMDIKAQARVNTIEESARALMLEVFGSSDFESIVDDHERRMRLHKIAGELRSLEGYLSLQSIDLPQYTTFVRAIDQFLEDDTESALQALRLSVQKRAVGDLQHFTEYWLGYMLTTVGEYDEALSMLRHDEQDFMKEDSQYLQLERIILETEFFVIAKARAKADEQDPKIHDGTGPFQRYAAVEPLLTKLTGLASAAAKSEDKRARHHTALEITRTRADILEWVAYHPDHLDEPLEADVIRELVESATDNGAEGSAPLSVDLDGPIEDDVIEALKVPTDSDVKDPEDIPVERAKTFSDVDVFRAWVLFQARAICLAQDKRDFDVDFALAECNFKLQSPEPHLAFETAEHALHHELAELREIRQVASLQECMLICHSRLLKLKDENDEAHRAEVRQVRQALSDARDTLKGMRQPRVTIFSQIQRRNIPQVEFRDELTAIYEQDRITSDE